MAKWESTSKFKFISVICETRWWSKVRYLKKVFGNIVHSEGSLNINIIETYEVQSKNF